MLFRSSKARQPQLQSGITIFPSFELSQIELNHDSALVASSNFTRSKLVRDRHPPAALVEKKRDPRQSPPTAAWSKASWSPKMMRTSVPRTLWRSCTRFPTTTNSRLVHGVAQSQARNALKQSASASAKPLALTIFRASPTALMRSYATASTAGTVPTGSEQQQELANQSIMTDPDHVNLKSSVHGITSEVGEKEVEEADVDMMAGIRHDMVRLAYPSRVLRNSARNKTTRS